MEGQGFGHLRRRLFHANFLRSIVEGALDGACGGRATRGLLTLSASRQPLEIGLQSLAQGLEQRHPTIHLSHLLHQETPQAWLGGSAT